MTHKFDGFHGRALYELNGLPEDVRNGPLLQGMLTLLIDDENEALRIIDILWAG